jgi:hypothetical protein
MDKEIHVIYASFKCKACDKAKIHLPKFCEKKGWKLKIIKEEYKDQFQVENYPTIFATINKEIVLTMEGFNLKKLKTNLNKY